MNSFSEAISNWETFYLLVGTAAVTLIGLLFIAVSINVELFQGNMSNVLQSFAALTFNCFFYVLLLAILFIIPGNTYLGLGIPILLLGILVTINAILQQKRTKKSQIPGIRFDIASRFTIPIISMGLLIILAIGILLQIEYTLYGFVVIIILLLGSASQNAWALLIAIKK
jgi:hypothetical protein